MKVEQDPNLSPVAQQAAAGYQERHERDAPRVGSSPGAATRSGRRLQIGRIRSTSWRHRTGTGFLSSSPYGTRA